MDKLKSIAWIKRAEKWSETEGFFFGIQNRVIDTNNYRKYILKQNSQD